MNKKGFALLLSAVLVISMMTVMPAMASDWQQFQKDEVNIGRTGDSAPITAPNETVSWSHYTTAGWVAIDSVPIVVGDYVYVLTSNNDNARVYKYSKSGTAAGGNWPVTVGSGNLQNSCPASGDGKVFVINTGYGTSNTPRLYALNANTGAESYDDVSVGTSDYQISCPITYHESGSVKRLFFGSVNMSTTDPTNLSDDGIYYCYDANDGNEVWNRSTTSNGGYYWAGAAVIGDYLVYGDDKSHLVSVEWNNVTNGEEWTEQEINVSTEYNVDAKEIRSSITWNNTGDSTDNYGHIYFTSKGGECYALGFNKSTGHFNTSDKWNTTIGYSTSTPAVYNGKVYVGHSSGFTNGKVYCLYETNGSEVWNVSIGPVQSSPAISTWYDNGTNNEIYIYVTTNSNNGGLYCIDKDGTEVWHNTSVGNNKYGLGGAAISGGWVFYGNDGGYLHGLSNWTRYDFDVGAGTDKWAYEGEVSNKPPSAANDPNNVFSSTDYDEIEADDGTNHYDYSDSCYAAHRFNFSIDDNEEDFITTINVTWNGRGYNNAGNGAQIYIWNGTAYEQPPLATTNSGDWVYLTGEKTSNIGNYINGGNVTVLVVQNTSGSISRSRIRTDYVKLVVTP